MDQGITHTFDGEHSLLELIFEQERKAKGYNHILYHRWSTPTTDLLSTSSTLLHQTYHRRSHTQVRTGEDYVAKLSLDIIDNYISAYIATTDERMSRSVLSEVEKEYPIRLATEGLVPITFWANTSRGPRTYHREISAQKWSEIQNNYPEGLRKNLNEMVTNYVPNQEGGGKLFLFSGSAGTGKTTFVRSLALEWKDRFDMHYVTDPDQFFGGGAEYLFDVVMAGDVDKWKLLVCEDTGELVSQDAKVSTGQALSRFLNVCDGMIGQGLRIQILLTTNEDIGRFHEAVVRPGRIAFNLPFPKFSRQEASAWLNQPIEREMTLAEMFAVKRGEQIPAERRAGII